MVFSPYGFGPPLGFTRASTCSWIDHPVSGLPRRTVRPVQTRFRCGSGILALTSHDKETRWLMQKARSHRTSPARTACRQSVSGSRFTPLTGVLFTFPSRYWFAIGRQGVFSLGRWSSRIPTRFHVPRGTQEPPVPRSVSGTGLSPAMARLPRRFPCLVVDHLMEALQPRTPGGARFGLIPFRSPLLWESRLISSPAGTEMFHFPAFASRGLCIQLRDDGT